MGTCGDLGGRTSEALSVIGTGQKQHLDLTDVGSRLGSAVHWQCCLLQMVGLSGLLFILFRKEKVTVCEGPWHMMDTH